ncbi:MAG: alkaline phosphatase family protein [Verrucomicrobiae bacterium]|nr:alkaline phosphatase family protein [Verrucomicrobiae bacterium]
MKTKKNIERSRLTLEACGLWCRNNALFGAAVAAVLISSQLARADDDGDRHFGRVTHVGDIFVIAMENHNFTQPAAQTSPQPILGNPAAPYINSLLTPGNPNAAQVSYALNYLNSGTGVHPSEPNYVWAEAGSDFGFHSDADPAAANGNTFYDNAPGLVSKITANGSTVPFWHFNYTPHLTGQLTGAGIPWKNYQEDIQLTTGATKSASGTNGPVNPFYGTTQYNYAAKHNPMAFFAESASLNLYPLAQLFTDLSSHAVGKYNWITPNQYNDAHTTLNGGFTYNGTHYTGDSANIAQGDNFLAQVVPEIMASKAYQNNGVIIIWWDETEGGDDTARTLQEVVISPLAKGNAYASPVLLSHSSDIKTVEEIFGLPLINNPIPVTETNNYSGYNNVATVNDLSDLFVPGVIPAPANLSVTSFGFFSSPHNDYVTQDVRITNNGSTPVTAPLFLVLDNLANATLANADGTTAVLAPLGSPYVCVSLGEDGILRPNESKTVKLQFLDPSNASISYTARLLPVTPAP